MLRYIHWAIIWAYIQCHKFYEKPTGWTGMGHIQLIITMKDLQPMIKRKEGTKKNIQIYSTYNI